ncbi:hypothetical protein [Falsiroseomonas stagni]|uniref:hypothetical protein n=1 Tax=Falsiroseomonas stagni TaxID=484882 RepID=UPI001587ACEA|nr:hypothetical protein [Falsiroseomonas stagni]
MLVSTCRPNIHVGLRGIEGALGQHAARAADLAAGQALLGGLEQQHGGAAEISAMLRQDLRRSHQDGDVAVMAAGMHHRHLSAVPSGAAARGEGQALRFLHR